VRVFSVFGVCDVYVCLMCVFWVFVHTFGMRFVCVWCEYFVCVFVVSVLCVFSVCGACVV